MHAQSAMPCPLCGHIHSPAGAPSASEFREIMTALNRILKLMTGQSDALARLQNVIINLTTVDASAIALIQGLAAQIKDAVATDDTASLTALAEQLEQQSAGLSAAVTANTPASTPPAGDQSGDTTQQQDGAAA